MEQIPRRNREGCIRIYRLCTRWLFLSWEVLPYCQIKTEYIKRWTLDYTCSSFDDML